LTIINPKIECLHKGIADFKACLDNFCEDLARSCENWMFFSCPRRTLLLMRSQPVSLKFFRHMLNFSQQYVI